MKAPDPHGGSRSRKRILEIGCGQGFHTFWLSKKNRAVGIDISEDNLKIARGRYPGTEFFLMDAGVLAFGEEVFDEIYALDVLEHVDNLDPVLKEITRVLRIYGRLVVNIPHWKSEAWLTKIRPTYREELHHVRTFPDDRLETELGRYRLKMIRKLGKGFLSHAEFFLLARRKTRGKTQLGIGNWRDSYATVILHVALLFFNRDVLKTPLRFFPLWLVTLPLGMAIESLGNRVFPKSVYYQFELLER